ncbi:MAG: hypothetical protein ACK5NC_04865 [Vibrio sp.]
MKRRNISALLLASLVVLPTTTFAAKLLHTERAERREEARDIRQDARIEAREDMRDCMKNDKQDNFACRVDKADAKSHARKQARKAKWD